jgi:hypothetical protein
MKIGEFVIINIWLRFVKCLVPFAHAEEVAKHNSVKLIDLEELVNLIIYWNENEKMTNDARALLPLQKIYVPE